MALERSQGQTAWLTGTSTNYNDDSGPDYVFEKSGTLNQTLQAPSADGLYIGTGTFNFNQSRAWEVDVTSRDFGGRANLRASCSFAGDASTYEATIMDSSMQIPTKPQAACANRSPGYYATLPVDEDCNGIADSWEATKIADANTILQTCGRNPITKFTGEEDIEPSARDANGAINCAGKFGDGLIIHDEYRGFHTYAKDASDQWRVQWAPTDPLNKQDVFFLADWSWPAGNGTQRLFADSVSGSGAILARETPFIEWHRVQEGYAGKVDPLGYRSALNANSRGNIVRHKAITVEYIDVEGAPVAGPRGCGTRTGGVLAYTGGGSNNGFVPICIYKETINTVRGYINPATGASFGYGLEPAGLVALQDVIVAHETGHKFTLQHPWRDPCCSFADYSTNLYALPSQLFTLTRLLHPQSIWARLAYYNAQTVARVLADRVDPDYIFPPPPKVGVTHVGSVFRVPQPLYDKDTDAVHETVFSSPVPPAISSIKVNIQLKALMDWTPRITMLRSLPPYSDPDPRVNWRFTTDDRLRLCVTPNCISWMPEQ